jgi:hypothetical protein
MYVSQGLRVTANPPFPWLRTGAAAGGQTGVECVFDFSVISALPRFAAPLM